MKVCVWSKARMPGQQHLTPGAVCLGAWERVLDAWRRLPHFAESRWLEIAQAVWDPLVVVDGAVWVGFLAEGRGAQRCGDVGREGG
jgi:hypothetical protein